MEKIVEIHDRLISGIRDFFNERGFSKAVLGLSGGIDSAVTCYLAKEALGGDNVTGLSMPSEYSSEESEQYARALAENLEVHFKVVPIVTIYASYLDVLEKELSIAETGEVEVYLQNIQARIRGNMLMAFSNRFGSLVLATGNKSEALMGYCTLYGDTVGALAPLADILKTTVYQLAEYINEAGEIIPRDIIERHPTAELKPGQKDQDTLPPYEVLDEILLCLEKGSSPEDLVKKGFDRPAVKDVIDTIGKNEYKKKQCPPGIKIGLMEN